MLFALARKNHLVTAIQAELFSWNDTWNVERFRPELAVPFSYWLVQNLPIPGQLKAEILGIDHVVQRLRALLDVIRRVSYLLVIALVPKDTFISVYKP